MHRKSPSKIWRKKDYKYRLTGTRFVKDGLQGYYPPREVAPGSVNLEKEHVEFEQEAKLVTWSTVFSAPSGYEQDVPYVIAILEFSNGQRFTTQLTDIDPSKLKFGQKFYPTLRKYYEGSEKDVIRYGLKWTR